MTNEMIAKAEWIARLMAKDGFKPEHIDDEAIMAYMEEIGRKIQKIQTIYFTKQGARQAMQAAVGSI